MPQQKLLVVLAACMQLKFRKSKKQENMTGGAFGAKATLFRAKFFQNHALFEDFVNNFQNNELLDNLVKKAGVLYTIFVLKLIILKIFSL